MGNLITGIFKKGNIAYVIIILGLFSIAPFIVISQYNHPSSDDFGLGLKQQNLGTEIAKAYNKRNGRYFQTVIARINPLRYHSFRMYKILPIILLCLFAAAMVSFIYYFLWKYYTFKYIFALSFLLIFLFILQMPSTSEGFFWFSGYITYMVPSILIFFLIPILLKAVSTNNRFLKIVLSVVSLTLCVVIIGSSEISFLIVDLIILFLFINQKLASKKQNFVLLIILIACMISSLVVIMAPGNNIRLTTFEYSKSITWAIFGSLFLTVYSFIRWVIPLLIASVFYSLYFGIPLSNRMAAGKTNFNIDFRLSVIFFLAFIYLSNFIYIWSTGSSPLASKRVLNIIYLFFILGWFFILQLFLNKQIGTLAIQKNKFSQLLLIVSLLLVILIPFDLNNNISTAYINLISGKAKKYDNELNNRYQLINSCKTDSLAVPVLSDIPKTIFFRDIKVFMEKDYNNKLYAKYFGKSYIYLDSKNPEPKSNQETIKEFGKEERGKWFDFIKNKK